jgi:hypothetical protein
MRIYRPQDGNVTPKRNRRPRSLLVRIRNQLMGQNRPIKQLGDGQRGDMFSEIERPDNVGIKRDKSKIRRQSLRGSRSFARRFASRARTQGMER